MKFKPIILIPVILILVAIMGFGVSAGESGPVVITAIHTSDNTQALHPGVFMTDGKPDTYWAVNPNSGGGWVELSLNQPALIHGLELNGGLGNGNRLTVEYQRENGHWSSFLTGSLRNIPVDGIIDLSYDQIVTGRIRIRIDGSNPAQARLNEIKLNGQPAKDIFHRINPRSVEASGHTSYLTRAEFLTDGDTYTAWMVKPRYRSGQNWLFETIENYLGIPINYNYNFNWPNRPSYYNYGEVSFDLGQVQTITNINIYFTPDARGDLTVESLSGGSWKQIGFIPTGQQPGWYRLSLNKISASKIRFTMEATGHESVGGIGEVEFWGYGVYTGSQQQELGPQTASLATAINRQFRLEKEKSRDHRLDIAVESATGASLTLELNGKDYSAQRVCDINGHTVYTLPLTTDMLFDDCSNYLRIKPQPGTMTGLKLTYNGDGIQSHQTPVLNDGLLLISGDDSAERIIDLTQKTAVEQIEVYTSEAGEIVLSYQNGNNWVTVNPTITTPGLIRYQTPFTTSRVRLVNPSRIDINEVRVLGSPITDRAPEVRLLRPEEYEVFDCDQLSDKYLVGFVDNPRAKVKVNGKDVFQIGHYFGCHLTAIGIPTWEETLVAAVATDEQGRIGKYETKIVIDKLPWFTLDQPAETVTTGNATYQISGELKKQHCLLKVNGQTVTDKKGRFNTQVNLVEGLNLIKIECVYEKPGNGNGNSKKDGFTQTVYRKVVRYSEQLQLQVTAPLDNSRTSAASLIVTGKVYGLTPVKVWINGKPALVEGADFQLPVTLSEGENIITVKAQDGRNEVATATLSVRKDGTAPLLTVVQPSDQTITNSATVTVSGTVADNSPSFVLVNGGLVEITAGRFETVLNLPEGWNQILIRAEDAAGNVTEKAIKVMVDTIAPAEFTPSADPSGWTNNNRPTVSFVTTDETSGIDHYEIRVGNGAWITPVVSPYRFATAIPDGERTIQVKAVDKAGNETIGEVKVYIDTVAPTAPDGFEVIPGIDRADLRWQDPKGEIMAYRIKRSPAFLDGSYRVIEREGAGSLGRHLDYEVIPGEEYTYSVQAIDRAGNYGAWTAERTITIGRTTQTVGLEGGTFKFHDCQVVMEQGAIGVQSKLFIFEPDIEFPENPYAIKVSPIYSLNLLNLAGDEELEVKFEQPVVLTINYADLRLPPGKSPASLWIYWYNEDTSAWERVRGVRNNREQKTLTVTLPHFSEYQVMASNFVSPDLESYYDLGVSPYLSYFKDNIETVSTSSGSLTVSATDLKLPGRDGFDLVIKRIYNSTAAQQEKILESNDDGDEWVDEEEKAPIDTFGYGWSLNIPWIETTEWGKFLRLPEGQTISISEFEEGEDGDEYHEGVHFSFKTDKTVKHRDSILFKKVIINRYILQMKDGTIYEFNPDGKVTKKIDPSGKNVITYEYDGRKLKKITDSIGRVIKFNYEEKGKYTLIKEIIVNENTVGERIFKYEHNEEGKLISFTDPKERLTAYEYDFHKELPFDINGCERKYNLYLLRKITYPTGAVSVYTNHLEKIEIEEYDSEGEVLDKYLSHKAWVKKHELKENEDKATNVTEYSYEWNEQYKWLRHDSFVPPFKYLKSCTITQDQKKIIENFRYLVDKYSWSYKKTYSLVNLDDLMDYNGGFLGILLVSREVKIKKDNDFVEVNRTNFEYNLPLRSVIMEDHYRGGAWAYRITSSYDGWGNLTERNDGSRDLKETYTYYAHPRIKNLVATKEVENKNPIAYNSTKIKTSYTYDDNLGKPLTVTVEGGPETLVTRYTYFDNGNLQTKIEPNGLEIHYEYRDYNINSETIKAAFPSKKIVKKVEDANNNPVGDIDTEYYFNYYTGMKEWEKDPRGYTTHYEYDKLNRITKVILPDDDDKGQNPNFDNNPYRKYDFNDTANYCDFYNEKGQQTRFQFDGLGRLTEIIKYTDGRRYEKEVKTSYEYDSLGRIVKVTDPLKRETKYDYDGLNRVVKVTYPDNNYVTLDYDDLTNSVTITDEERQKVVTERSDWANRLVEANQYYKYINNGSTEEDTYTWSFVYDSLGHRLRQIDPELQQMDREYDALGRLVKTTLPTAALVKPGERLPQLQRPKLTYEYDKMGNLTEEISANGNASGNPERYKTEYEYDLLGRRTNVITRATEIVDDIPVTRTYITQHFYDAAGNRVRTVLPNGKQLEYKYSARGWLLSETAPYDPADPSTKQITRYRYDVLGNKIAVIDPRNKSDLETVQNWYTTQIEDGIVKYQDFDPRTNKTFTTWYVYDDLNRLCRTILPDIDPPADPYADPPENPYTEITYDLVGNKKMERDANGVTTSYEYTPRNWLLEVKDGRGRVQKTYAYDKTGRVKSVTDFNNQTVINAYDSLGRLRKVTDPLTHYEEYQYDKVGNRIAVTDARKNKTNYSYNSLGWLTGVQQPMGNFSQYRYDLNGNMVETIAPNNLSTKVKYDELNRVVESVDSLENSTKYRYDEVGNRSWMKDRRGTEWDYEYYANNLLKRVDATGADGTNYWVEYDYDEAGNRMKVTDSGNEIKYNFKGESYLPDPLNRINSIKRSFDGASYQTAYRYDKAGLVTGILYPEALSMVEYQYNKDLNQLTEVIGYTAPNGISYNDDGSLRGINYANGATAVYNYDANRRLDDMKVTVGAEELLNLDYHYDEVGNIKTVNDGGKLKFYEYDELNQLTKTIIPGTFMETTPTPGTAALKTNDVLGNGVFEFTPVLSAVMGLDYNASSIGIDFGSVISGVKVVELVPDKDSSSHRITENTLALYVSNDNINYNLIPSTSYEYRKDPKGIITLTLKEKRATRYLKFHVKFDERGRSFEPINKSTFKIDKDKPLEDIARMLRIYQEAEARTEEYQYDAAGNRKLLRVTLARTAEFKSLYYTNSDRLKTDGKYAFVYDNAGNMIKKGNAFEISGDTVTFTKTSGEDVEYWEYKYDLLNRLIKVTKNGKIVSEYAYDPEGFRVVKKAKGQTTHYVFQGTEPIFEKNKTTGKVKSFVYALGKHLARVDGVIGDDQKYWYVTDHVGSIRAVTDKDGKKVWSADYLAFGKQFGEEKNADYPDFEELHSFTGKEYDPDTGLHYYNARWYDSDLGRFVSEDPVADPNNPNLYSYTANNPLRFRDPTGLSLEDTWAEQDAADAERESESDTTADTIMNVFDDLAFGDSETVANAINTLIDMFGMDEAMGLLGGFKDDGLVENRLEIAYEDYWSSLATDFYKDYEKLGEALAVLWQGIDFFGERAMPEFGWGITSHKDIGSMNQVRAIQAALGVTVDGKYGNQTRNALQNWGFKGERVGQKIVNTFLGLFYQDFIWPVDNPIITSPFGPRQAPKTKNGYGSKNHPGIDMIGQPTIKASGNGRVVKSEYDKLNGWHVVIDHGFGRTTSYVHLDAKSNLNVGDRVSQGQTVGIMGNSGESGGVHLHFGYREYGIAVDPMNILPLSSQLNL